MPIRAIAFDLGNTLVDYYQREEFSSVLVGAIRNAHAALSGFTAVRLDEAQTFALTENTERDDGKVRPLQERFDRIFGLADQLPAELRDRAARAFLQPIFDRARKYQDSDPTLRTLRRQGYKLAIVSNAPWGSPGHLWREELKRLDLADAIDFSFFCVDCGWRKPAPAVFDRVLQQLEVKAGECLFIGDEPLWDIEGARAAGMPAVLIDRADRHSSHQGARVQNLGQIAPFLRGSL